MLHQYTNGKTDMTMIGLLMEKNNDGKIIKIGKLSSSYEENFGIRGQLINPEDQKSSILLPSMCVHACRISLHLVVPSTRRLRPP